MGNERRILGGLGCVGKVSAVSAAIACRLATAFRVGLRLVFLSFGPTNGRNIYQIDIFYRCASGLEAPTVRTTLGGICMKFGCQGESTMGVRVRTSIDAVKRALPDPAAYLMLAAIACMPCGPRAMADNETDATSSRAARDEAIRAIPWQRLAPNERRVVRSIVNEASIYRRLPTRIIDCNPAMFTFLIQHPEVVADVWRVMGVSRVKLDRLPDGGFRGTDGAGTTGTVRFLACEWGPDAANTALVLADGSYDGAPFVVPLKAKSLVLMRSGAIKERNGRYYVTVRADAFVHVEQTAVEIVAKTVQPWVNATADRNLVETLSFVSNFSRTAERNPDGMKRMAARLTGVDDATRSELVQICYETAGRYGRLDARSYEQPMLVAKRSAGAVW
jgi:hypothetical protein